MSPPGELFINCLSVSELINHSVATGPNPLLNDSGELEPFDNQRIRGGPNWMYSDYYTIDAKSSDPAVAASADPYSPAARRLLNGPMLHSLLVDRFQLKMHREVEQVPMFALVVANSGFKLQPLAKGVTAWTEEQSRKNFESVSHLVTPGDPAASKLLKHPLSPAPGGDIFHNGGQQFSGTDDPDYKIVADWIRSGK